MKMPATLDKAKLNTGYKKGLTFEEVKRTSVQMSHCRYNILGKLRHDPLFKIWPD